MRVLKLTRSTFLLAGLVILSFTSASSADNFVPQNKRIGDGSDGAPFGRWTHSPQNIAISQVSFKLRKFSGGDDAYLNLRFGDGDTFENGRRVYIQDNSQNTVTFSAGNKSPNGQQLVLNAYNGGFIITGYKIKYSKETFIPQSNKPPSANFPGKPVFRPLHKKPVEGCNDSYLKKPLIEVSDKEARGGLFSGKYRLYGSIFAACVNEAGYYERGKLKDKLDFPLSSDYERRSFEFKVRSGRGGAIKVYSANGEVESLSVDDMLN